MISVTESFCCVLRRLQMNGMSEVHATRSNPWSETTRHCPDPVMLNTEILSRLSGERVSSSNASKSLARVELSFAWMRPAQTVCLQNSRKCIKIKPPRRLVNAHPGVEKELSLCTKATVGKPQVSSSTDTCHSDSLTLTLPTNTRFTAPLCFWLYGSYNVVKTADPRRVDKRTLSIPSDACMSMTLLFEATCNAVLQCLFSVERNSIMWL